MMNMQSQRQLTAEGRGRLLCKHDFLYLSEDWHFNDLHKERTPWLSFINDLGYLLRHVKTYGLSLERKQDGGNNESIYS